MTNPTHLKLGLLGLAGTVVAVAVALQLLVGGGDASSDNLDGGQPSLGVPAPGFAGLVDEMVVIEGTEENGGPLSLGVPAPGFAGLVDEMVVFEGEPVTPYADHEVKNLEEPPQIEPTQAPDQPPEVLIVPEATIVPEDS